MGASQNSLLENGPMSQTTPRSSYTHGSKSPSYFQDQVVITDLLTLGTSQEKPRSKAEVISNGNEKTKELKSTYSSIVSTTAIGSILPKSILSVLPGLGR